MTPSPVVDNTGNRRSRLHASRKQRPWCIHRLSEAITANNTQHTSWLIITFHGVQTLPPPAEGSGDEL